MAPQIPGDNEKSHILDLDLDLDPICRSGGFPTLPRTDPPASRVVDSSNSDWIESLTSIWKKLEQTRIAGNSSSHSTCNEDVSDSSKRMCYFLPTDNQRSLTCNILSLLDNNELHIKWDDHLSTQSYFLLEDPKTLFPINCAKKDNQRSLDNNELHMRMKIMQWLSSYALSTTLFFFISCNIWSSISSVIHVPPLSIWPSLLWLSVFMVFICAVAVMVLVRAPFTSMQKAMLIFWAILLHLQSANSIIDVYLTLVLALLVIWYAFRKKQPPDEDVINKYAYDANKLPICQSS